MVTGNGILYFFGLKQTSNVIIVNINVAGETFSAPGVNIIQFNSPDLLCHVVVHSSNCMIEYCYVDVESSSNIRNV